MKIPAKKLILGLLLASEGEALSAASLVSACALFGVTENSARVALTRLSAEQKLESAGVGFYRLGPAAQRLGREAAAWRQSAARLVPWRGDYLVAFTANLGRRDRGLLKRRERALELLGFRELERGLHVRPHNIAPDAALARKRLDALGIDPECRLFVSDFDARQRREIDRLWDCDGLNRHYRRQTRRLSQWAARHDTLELHVAARESYLIGAEAIRSLVFDPWLPEPMVNAEARHAFFEAVCGFDDLGKSIWHRFSTGALGLPVPHVALGDTASPTRH